MGDEVFVTVPVRCHKVNRAVTKGFNMKKKKKIKNVIMDNISI